MPKKFVVHLPVHGRLTREVTAKDRDAARIKAKRQWPFTPELAHIDNARTS